MAFDFDQAVQKQFKAAQGRVAFEEFDWLQAGCFVQEGAHRSKTIYLEIVVLEGWRTVQDWRVPLPGFVTGNQEVIPQQTLMDILEPQDIIRMVVARLVEGIRPLIYECDPRIGDIWLDFRHDSPLLPCPLFDPPDPVFPAWLRVPPPNARSCPLCHGEFTLRRRPMWAGGNLRWAHADCWGKGL